MLLWMRALFYMAVVGGGWLVAIPLAILYVEAEHWPPAFRSLGFQLAGAAMFACGAGLAMWAGRVLVSQGKGTPFPLDKTKRLVTTGPYRYLRNPQAVAMMLMVSGEAAVIQSSWLWIMLPATLVYLEGLVGPLEHRQMARDFGDDYRRYASRVRKWIPQRPEP